MTHFFKKIVFAVDSRIRNCLMVYNLNFKILKIRLIKLFDRLVQMSKYVWLIFDPAKIG